MSFSSFILLLALQAGAWQMVVIESQSPGLVSNEKLNQFSAKAILGTDPNYSFANTLSKLSEEEKKKVWEDQLSFVISSAFNSNATGMQTYVQEWSTASGLSVEQINSIVQRVYVESQVNRSRAENEAEKFTQNQMTLKSFGLNSSLTAKEVDLLISSGYNDDYKNKSVSEKLAMLDKFSPEARGVFVTRTFALAGIEKEDRVLDWIAKRAPEQARFDLAIRELNKCLRVSEKIGGSCDYRYLNFLDPMKMSGAHRCEFVQNIINEGTMATGSLSTQLRNELQKKLNYLPTTMNCLSGFLPQKVVPNLDLNAFNSGSDGSLAASAGYNASAFAAPKVAGCGLEKSASLISLADASETILGFKSRKGQKVRAGLTTDNPNCVLVLNVEELAGGKIQISGNAIGNGYKLEVPKLEFKDREELKKYIASLRAKASQQWLKETKGASPAASKVAPVNR